MSTKLVVSSDWHLDAVTAGVRRLSDLRVALSTILNRVQAEKDAGHHVLSLFLGDLCDPDSGTPVWAAICTALAFLTKLGTIGVPSVWLAGNHDVIEDGSGVTTISPLARLFPFTGRVVEGPESWVDGNLVFLALPFTAKSHAYNPALYVSEVLPVIWELHPEKTLVVLGHLNIAGVVPGEETTEMPRGREVAFPLDEINKWPGEKVLLHGHYHRQQVFNGVHIPGALERLTFGEEGHQPGFLVVEVADES
jgi:DNA repair exonuclease SbcCD nuclease subunit